MFTPQIYCTSYANLYSMWQSYRDSDYQQKFEGYLQSVGFVLKAIHTSGHAAVSDIQRLITDLAPKKLIPIHTMKPDAFKNFCDKTELMADGVEFEVQ